MLGNVMIIYYSLITFNFELVPLKTINRRFVTLQEVNRNEHLNEALVKQMTGNDKLDYRKLYREGGEFRPQFT